MKTIWKLPALIALCALLLAGCHTYTDRPVTEGTAVTTTTAATTAATTMITTTTTTTTTAPVAVGITLTPTTTTTQMSTTTATAATTVQTTAPAPQYPDMEQEVLTLLNSYRADAGRAPLTLDYTYYGCAKRRTEECMQLWSHTRPNGSSSSSVYAEFGLHTTVKLCSENLAIYFKDAASIMEALMNSDGHRSNILSPDFNTVAICILPHPDYEGLYVMSQLFIKR